MRSLAALVGLRTHLGRMAHLDARVPKVGDEAADVELLDERRRPVRLSELWAKGPLVVVFYRGDWSMPCRRQLAAYRDETLAFRKAGARLCAISVDEPPVSAFLRAERGLAFPLLCDPSRAAVDAWGLLERTAHGGAARPATFVIDRAGRVRSRSLDADERRASPEAMLYFVRRGGASGGRPLRARFVRAGRKLRALEQQLVAGLRALVTRGT
jgi:peroxiredoxin